MTSYALIGAIEQGLVYGIMAIGVYLTFRILDFPDLTVDGSLPLGAAISATLMTSGISPWIALLFAMLGGFFAGAITAILNTKFKILHLLASILTMIALYSINIRIMGGPNLSLLGTDTLFDFLGGWGLDGYLANPLFFAVTTLVIVAGMVWFLSTELGQTLLATGDNPQMITSQGVNTHWVLIFGVGLSNALVAISGALIAQNQGAADVNMGVGTIVSGLAAVIVGETLFGTSSLPRALIAVVLGSIVYRLAIAMALGMEFGEFSIAPSDLNLITAVLVVIALISPQLKTHLRSRRAQ